MFNERIKEERGRLKLNQEEFGALAGVTKRTVIEWEKGLTSPTTVQLSALFLSGVDPCYIVTGIRMGQYQYQSQSMDRMLIAADIDKSHLLSSREENMLAAFREASDRFKEAAQVMLDAAIENKPRKGPKM